VAEKDRLTVEKLMEQQAVAQQFLEAVETFNRQAAALGFPDIASYYWYHTIDLPNGLVTPGLYDYRATLLDFHFPADMRGMRALDVGSATGFFAFEFARRGAEVVSVELPSLEAIDRFPGQDIGQIVEKINRMIVPPSVDGLGGYVKSYTAAQLYFYMLEGPFEFCRKLLGARVTRCYSTVYDLSASNTGGVFDFVFMGDVLVHTINPFQALAAVAPLCRGALVFAGLVPDAPDGRPAMLYVGGDSLDADEVSWWLPNKPCLTALLKKFGFRAVVDVGRHTGVLRPSGYVFERSILRAER
jgi:tRNA (mo5U34)-methyltransferase